MITKGLDLMEKASGVVDKSMFGMIFPFAGLKKQAVDTYVKNIQDSNLSPEDKMMAIYNTKKTFKELKNQLAIAEIAKNAAKEGTDFSESSGVDDEWFARYMDSAKFVSNEEVQVLWGNVLAGEFESPGSAPLSIIRILSELTREHAAIFSELCSLRLLCIAENHDEDIFNLGEYLFVDISEKHSYQTLNDITFPEMQELEQLGLIFFDSSANFVKVIQKSEFPSIHLVSENCVLTVKDYPDSQFPLGSIRFTAAGKYISRFVPRKQNDEHIVAIKKYLEERGAKCAPTPELNVTE